MTVLIAGAGIGGLALGLSLHQAGVPFRIVESVRDIRPMGVGINLQPHAVRELFELGLEPELDKLGIRTGALAYFSAQGKPIWDEARGIGAGYKWPQYSLHRGGLQMLLLRTLLDRAGDVIETATALDGWTQGESHLSVHLTDRTTGQRKQSREASVLIGCDGINSVTRQRLFPDEGVARWGGTIMWRGVTIGPAFLGGKTVVMAGRKDQKFVVYPIEDMGDGNVLINWIADLEKPADYDWNKQDWSREGVVADFAPHFADWRFDWLDIPWVIENAERVWEYPMVDRDPLPRWSHGRVTLLGDAAHAMYPIGSNGASQSILDARVLAREIRRHGPTARALEAYDEDRRVPANKVVLANRNDGPDKVLDEVAARAPNGFDRIEDVMSLDELEKAASAYKAIAGMNIEALNARPALMDL